MSIMLARAIRAHALRMVHQARASHIGTCLSMADLLAVLYGKVLRIGNSLHPDWPDRDRFILSKGHGAAILYATLAEVDFFPVEWLDTYCQNGSRLPGHVTCGVPGVEVSTGSLGHGLPIGCGMALAGKREDCNHLRRMDCPPIFGISQYCLRKLNTYGNIIVKNT